MAKKTSDAVTILKRRFVKTPTQKAQLKEIQQEDKFEVEVTKSVSAFMKKYRAIPLETRLAYFRAILRDQH